MIQNLTETLQKYWGFSTFRPPQDQIIKNVLNKKDTVALLPTGGGKSLCYQLPALLFSGKTIVITPLIALMEDQVFHLKNRGIPAQCIHSHMTYRQIDGVLDNFVFGDTKILYISPERIDTDIFRERYLRVKVDLIAIDEAHCISQWGYDFRPSYFLIPKLREWKPGVVFLALTATATHEVEKDIIEKLSLKVPSVFRKSYQRNNISFFAIETNDKWTEMTRILQKINACGIIYVRNRKETLELSHWLSNRKITALPYHGGMDKIQRSEHQNAWMENKVRYMVATNAFGMGIDKPDVRVVIHLDIPASLEEYYQEAGRAGRDGNESWAIMIYDEGDLSAAKQKWEEQYPDISVLADIYDQLCRFFKIAYGSGVGETYDFSIQDFSNNIKIPSRKVFFALQILEKEGWFQLSEGFREPTKVMITCSHQELKEPGFIPTSWENIIVYLLRRYEGLFVQPVKIDEPALAKAMEISMEELTETLKQMEIRQIIRVSFAKTSPYLIFLKERPQKEHFYIDKKNYEALKIRAFNRLKSMIDYTESQEHCRQKMILDYFDEEMDDCGKCDICRFKKASSDTSAIIPQIKTILTESTQKYILLTIKDVMFLFPYNKRKLVRLALQQLESERMVEVDNAGKIKWVSHAV
ncbi:MAG: RecQ family ATP-dependent DNA helicase [Saprospiraceae bacterium]|nr:RecQ family ATP-dependent DNA helicase [Saprospiraceae bacterium]